MADNEHGPVSGGEPGGGPTAHTGGGEPGGGPTAHTGGGEPGGGPTAHTGGGEPGGGPTAHTGGGEPGGGPTAHTGGGEPGGGPTAHTGGGEPGGGPTAHTGGGEPGGGPTAHTGGGDKITIIINNTEYQVDRPSLTGAELKGLAKEPMNRMVVRIRRGPGAEQGGDDEAILDDQSVLLVNGMKFRIVNAGTFG